LADQPLVLALRQRGHDLGHFGGAVRQGFGCERLRRMKLEPVWRDWDAGFLVSLSTTNQGTEKGSRQVWRDPELEGAMHISN
jgi:hypothetical protein